jgi:hypothetical protein
VNRLRADVPDERLAEGPELVIIFRAGCPSYLRVNEYSPHPFPPGIGRTERHVPTNGRTICEIDRNVKTRSAAYRYVHIILTCGSHGIRRASQQ